MSQTNICCYDNTDLSIYRHAAKSVPPPTFFLHCLELNPLLVFGRKSQFLFLQSKVKGHAELLRSGEEGWMREAMADRCLQRADCTSLTIRRGEGFYHYYQKSQSNAAPL